MLPGIGLRVQSPPMRAYMGDMSESTPLSGPDLGAGVPAERVVEGAPLLGHADGEAVMLVRTGGKVFATAAACTHYGGPLAEGLVVGTTVRCPWHHACFDLETGLARGPALNPLARYDVIAEARLLRVAKRRADHEAPKVAGPSSVVIVGAGAAGAACAETLRRHGYRASITLVADEPPGPVDRPNLSKDYLAGSAPEEWIALRDKGFYEKLGIDFVLGDGVRRIDREQHRVELGKGDRLQYGALLLATGCAPRRLTIPGADRAHVFVLRTLADSRAIIAQARAGARAVVIGASFIGLEVAASLRKREVAVEVVSPEPVPLGRVVGDKLGSYVRSLHERHGVTFHLGRTPAQIEEKRVVLDDGTALPADFVVLGVGVAPRTQLAEQAGLTVERGVVVDDHLRTSDPDIYAAGDIAAYPDARSGGRVRIEHWTVAVRQGQAVARTMLGLGGPYRDVPFFWSAHYDVALNYVGHAQRWDRVRERGSLEQGKFVCAYEQGGKVLAVVTLGEDCTSLQAEAAMEAGDEAKLAAL
jgi:NADPH-dependent 2,4-dienoyl-CoA reductase/sulfur reductase-like enzyme/nitrite reductase/ring-hydroxylating ferredoxin subunit